MWVRLLRMACLAAAIPAVAQEVCPPVPAYGVCEIVLELTAQEAAVHPNPYLTVDLRAELRSPKAKTLLLPAYWDGGRRMVIRFSPNEPGAWDFRLSGNIARFQNKLGKVEVTPSEDPGFLRPANVHHWRLTESLKAHLWVGDTLPSALSLSDAAFASWLESRAGQKVTHIRTILPLREAFAAADQPRPEFFQAWDRRLLAINSKGLFTDLVLASNPGELTGLFPGWQERQRFARYVISRYSALHLTWQVFDEFEAHAEGRSLLKEIGSLLRQHDPYQHPRSTGARDTSGPALPDQWMNYVVHRDTGQTLGAIEHHLFATPFVNIGFAPAGADAATFRRQLWKATMTGQYPTAVLSAASPDSQQATALKAWASFLAGSRYWELEPYYDVDGARALALPGVEYLLYLEKPGMVEILIEKHDYNVTWMNPVTGETFREKKEFKGERYMGEPPSKQHDWVLLLSREGRKESMLRSYKFESRPNLMQEIEQNPQRAPFEILEPSGDELSLTSPPTYSVKLKRETRGTREMFYLWTGEVPTEGRGYRVLGTGATGRLRLPDNLAAVLPAVFNLRLYAINAVGKVYSVDRVHRLTR